MIIVGADLNAVWDANHDRSSSNASRDQELATAILGQKFRTCGCMAIMQGQQGHKPNPIDSFFSHQHKSLLRIYYLFSPLQHFYKNGDAVLLPIALSDHKGVLYCATLSCLSKWGGSNKSSLLRNDDFSILV